MTLGSNHTAAIKRHGRQRSPVSKRGYGSWVAAGAAALILASLVVVVFSAQHHHDKAVGSDSKAGTGGLRPKQLRGKQKEGFNTKDYNVDQTFASDDSADGVDEAMHLYKATTNDIILGNKAAMDQPASNDQEDSARGSALSSLLKALSGTSHHCNKKTKKIEAVSIENDSELENGPVAHGALTVHSRFNAKDGNKNNGQSNTGKEYDEEVNPGAFTVADAKGDGGVYAEDDVTIQEVEAALMTDVSGVDVGLLPSPKKSFREGGLSVQETGQGDDKSTDKGVLDAVDVKENMSYEQDTTPDEGSEETKKVSSIMTKASDHIKTDQAGIARAGIQTALSAVKLSQDPSKEMLFDTIGVMGGLASAVVPPPAGLVIGSAMTFFGSIFGSGSRPDATNEQVIEKMEQGFNQINLRLDDLSKQVNDISQSLNVLTSLAQYNIEVVEMIYHEIWVAPFEKIHSSYTTLIEQFLPTTTDTSWDDFFDRAYEYRRELDREAYDAFHVDNILEYVRWYESAGGVNDVGRCGQVFLYQYLMAVRFELFFIASMGSYVRKNTQECDRNDASFIATRFCWENHPTQLQKYADKYVNQLSDYDEKILVNPALGGLGIEKLMRMSATELLGGNLEGNLGFCFRCEYLDQEGGCSEPPTAGSNYALCSCSCYPSGPNEKDVKSRFCSLSEKVYHNPDEVAPLTRIVNVSLPGTESLQLTEVQVYGPGGCNIQDEVTCPMGNAACPNIDTEWECLSSRDGRISRSYEGQKCAWCNGGSCTSNNNNKCEPSDWLSAQSSAADHRTAECTGCGNLALRDNGGRATQSSDESASFPANNAINGDIAPSDWKEISHTLHQNDPWWAVTLASSFDVREVRLWNRRDCCSERLSDAKVKLLDSGGNVITEKSIGNARDKMRFELEFYPFPRYVKISLPGDNRYLHLEEVEVFADVNGVETSIAKKGRAIAWQSTKYEYTGTYPASNAIDDKHNTFSHTAKTTNPWWKVDFGLGYDIRKITVWNSLHKDAVYTGRLTRAIISILDADEHPIAEATLGEATGIHRFELEYSGRQLRLDPFTCGDCLPKYYCQQSRCWRKRADNDSCEGDYQCLNGGCSSACGVLRCNTVGKKRPGDSCNSSTECCSGYCHWPGGPGGYRCALRG